MQLNEDRYVNKYSGRDVIIVASISDIENRFKVIIMIEV